MLLFLLLAALPGVEGHADQFVIEENFNTLDNWLPVTFPKIKRHSVYTLVRTDGNSILQAQSDASASGLRYAKEFNVYDHASVRWKWKVDNVYSKGEVEKKSGDDYPLRVYIMFQYDPEKASFGEKILYGLARTVYGDYPPHSSLNYIWANRPHKQAIFSSPYTDRSKLIILRSGEAEIGTWIVEEVNILDDYKKAFGTLPPERASIAIMNDSDNTGESSVSYLDFIQVLKKE
jgi:hypothetical protein